jgi:hypothetical protein
MSRRKRAFFRNRSNHHSKPPRPGSSYNAGAFAQTTAMLAQAVVRRHARRGARGQ